MKSKTAIVLGEKKQYNDLKFGEIYFLEKELVQLKGGLLGEKIQDLSTVYRLF